MKQIFLNIKNYNNFEIISLLFFYSVLVLSYFLISKDLIKKDIYEFLKDKITLIVLFIVVIELIYLQVKLYFNNESNSKIY